MASFGCGTRHVHHAFWFIIVCLLLLPTMLCAETTPPDHLIVGVYGEPYLPWSHPDTGEGFDIDVLRLIAEASNVELELRFLPWRRCLHALQTGEINALIPPAYSPDREELGRFPRTQDWEVDTSKYLHQDPYVLYVLKTSKLDFDGQQFSHLTGTIAASPGFVVIPTLEKFGATVDAGTDNVVAQFKKLIAKRVQGVAIQEVSSTRLLREHPEIASQVKKLPVALQMDYHYVMFSHQFVKQYPTFVETFWNHNADIVNSEEYKQLEAKWELYK